MKSLSFISFEGLDASGKTTLAKKVKEELIKNGFNTVLINKKDLDYDYNKFIGNRLKMLNSLLFDCSPNDNLIDIPERCWIYLSATWFSIVSKNYVEPLRQNHIVITDSWVDKRLARFELIESISKEELNYLYEPVSYPDLSFFVNVNPEQTWERRTKHSKKDFGFLINDESFCTKENFIEYQNKIYKNYIKRMEKQNSFNLDGNKSSEDLTEEVVGELLRRFKHE